MDHIFFCVGHHVGNYAEILVHVVRMVGSGMNADCLLDKMLFLESLIEALLQETFSSL